MSVPLYGVDHELPEGYANANIKRQGIINSLLLLEDLIFCKNQLQCAILRMRESQNFQLAQK